LEIKLKVSTVVSGFVIFMQKDCIPAHDRVFWELWWRDKRTKFSRANEGLFTISGRSAMQVTLIELFEETVELD
jgi:hypothetical protein